MVEIVGSNIIKAGGEPISLEQFKNKEITPENIKKIAEDYSVKELNKFKTFAVGIEDYDTAKLIKEALKEKTPEKTDQENAEKQSEIDEEKREYEKKKDIEISDLKAKLSDSKNEMKELGEKISSLKEEIDSFKEELNKNNKENSEILEELKNAKKKGDNEEVKKLQGIINNLKLEKKELKDKFAGELPKYDSQDIGKLKTKWISFNLVKTETVNGQTVLSGPQLLLRRNIRSRNKINKTIKMFNKIKDDPKRGVKYILAKSSMLKGGKISTGIRNVINSLRIRDVDKFDELFNKQKKKFIDDLKSKMQTNTISDVDKKTFQLIEDRIDYYQKAYKRKFITV